MLQDGLFLADGSVAENFQIASYEAFPGGTNNIGEMFFLTVGPSKGLHVFTSNGWEPVGSSLGYVAENVANKNANNGYAGLDAAGKISSAQLPALSITDTFVVSSQAAMIGLTGAETGDVAIRTDLNKSFILRGASYSTLGDWQELLTPTSSVVSVNGKTGVVSLTTSDVPEGTNQYFTNDLARSAISVTGSGGSYNSTTGVITLTGGGGSLFTSTTAGIVPASGGGTTNYLRADGTWATVSASVGNTIQASSGATLQLLGGAPASATSASGALSAFSAAGGSTSGASGIVSIYSGNTTSGNSGAVNIFTGNANSSGTAGNLTVETGDSTGNNTGDLILQTGISSSTTAGTGHIYLRTAGGSLTNLMLNKNGRAAFGTVAGNEILKVAGPAVETGGLQYLFNIYDSTAVAANTTRVNRSLVISNRTSDNTLTILSASTNINNAQGHNAYNPLEIQGYTLTSSGGSWGTSTIARFEPSHVLRNSGDTGTGQTAAVLIGKTVHSNNGSLQVAGGSELVGTTVIAATQPAFATAVSGLGSLEVRGHVDINFTTTAMRVRSTNATTASLFMQNSTSGTTLTDGFSTRLEANGVDASLWNFEAGYIRLATNNTERFRILSDGSWSIGSNGTTVGTSGQVLTSNGAAAPTWQTPAAAPAAAGTLTGTTLASNVVSSSLTSVGTINTLTLGGPNTTGTLFGGNSTGSAVAGGSILVRGGFGGATSTAGNVDIQAGDADAATTTRNGGNILLRSGYGTGAGTSIGGSIQFHTATTSAFAERMRITNTGALAFSGATNYGTSGQVLTSAGNAPPTWATPTSTYGTVGDTTSASLTTSATTANQVVASLATATYRSAKFQVQVVSGSAYQMSEISVIHDGTTAFMSEYGTISTGASLATFDADVSGGNLRLLVTPVNAVSTIKVVRTAVTV